MFNPAGWKQRRVNWFVVLGMMLLVAGLGLVFNSLLKYRARQSAASEPRIDLLNANNTQAGLLLSPSAPAEPFADPPTPTAIPTPPLVVVYISGAVVQPDVYEMPHDARVKDVVLAAGGLAEDADSERINLAARIHDEQHIHVPRIGDVQQPVGGEAAPAEAPQPVSAGLVNINTASAAELEELPGIGAVMAQRIVDYRAAHGTFASIEDLQDVRGIGPSIFAELRSRITVADQ